jgi:uncharacterized membrane protein YdjX (TVP38/TMEM64 family)
MVHRVSKLQRRMEKIWKRLNLWQKIAAVIAGVTSLVLGILFLVYSERFFHMLAPYAQKMRDLPAGWLIIWFAIVIVSFPPLIGYSSLLTAAGFVYGFPRRYVSYPFPYCANDSGQWLIIIVSSWFIVASATVVGSTCSFIVSRYLLKSTVNRLVANDPRFAALALTVKHDGIKLLIMIRLCPLPYSLSNGALATVPTVHWAAFALATAIASLKLLLHVFVGARLGEIAEKGEEMDAKTKAISYASAIIGAVVGIGTGLLIYRQTKARARELEQQEAENARRTSGEDLENEYADDPDAAEAAVLLREEDDISLHSSVGHIAPVYRDESSDDLVDSDEDADDVFRGGDGPGGQRGRLT